MIQDAETRQAILKALAAAPDPSPQLCERIAARMAGPLLESLTAPAEQQREAIRALFEGHELPSTV